ncbi:MAG TPA: hypothetical protein VL832_18035 [Puia sp.]|jgi:hypothetical protein|nr:hypothetical protein [Puia sp.]
MKLDRSAKLTLLYCLFTLLYTFYIAGHSNHFGPSKSNALFYQIEFLLIDGYVFFILQGLILGSKNWGILLLLPLGVLVVTVIVVYLMVWILAWGGGTLLKKDEADMFLATLIWLSLSYYCLRFITPGKKPRR